MYIRQRTTSHLFTENSYRCVFIKKIRQHRRSINELIKMREKERTMNFNIHDIAKCCHLASHQHIKRQFEYLWNLIGVYLNLVYKKLENCWLLLVIRYLKTFLQLLQIFFSDFHLIGWPIVGEPDWLANKISFGFYVII